MDGVLGAVRRSESVSALSVRCVVAIFLPSRKKSSSPKFRVAFPFDFTENESVEKRWTPTFEKTRITNVVERVARTNERTNEQPWKRRAAESGKDACYETIACENRRRRREQSPFDELSSCGRLCSILLLLLHHHHLLSHLLLLLRYLLVHLLVVLRRYRRLLSLLPPPPPTPSRPAPSSTATSSAPPASSPSFASTFLLFLLSLVYSLRLLLPPLPFTLFSLSLVSFSFSYYHHYRTTLLHYTTTHTYTRHYYYYHHHHLSFLLARRFHLDVCFGLK